ncbi:MAG: SPFH domain-containing protein [Polyangiaceae bacterium]
MLKRLVGLGILLSCCAGCYGETVESGHLALLYDPHDGLQRDPLGPGYHRLGVCMPFAVCKHVEDFDVTYSKHQEEVRTTSQEDLALDLRVAIRYRPIISELYLLDTEVGPNYYDEVVQPEFRSAARGVISRHSYQELQKNNQKIEDEIEEELRRRIKGKHIEISAVTLEGVTYAPEIADTIRARLVNEQEAIKKKSQLESESLARKLELERSSDEAKFKTEQLERQKEADVKVAQEQAAIDKVQAETEASVTVTKAKADSEARKMLAKATEAEKKAEAQSVTPLEVQMHAYDALGKMGGEGTTIYLGDWSHAPAFLFPPAAAMYGGGAMASPYHSSSLQLTPPAITPPKVNLPASKKGA